MSSHTITHTCGHTIVHQLYGPTGKGFGGRESRAEWLRQQPCLTCKREAETKARANANAADAEQSAAANLASGLPALVGTERQIAWAESIRAKAIAAELNRVHAMSSSLDMPQRLREAGLTQADYEIRRHAVYDAGVAARLTIETETSAKWWIDNRNRVEHYVYDARRDAAKLMVADIQAKREAEMQAERAAAKAAEAKRMRDYQAQRVEASAKAGTFVVSDRAGSVEVTGDKLSIRSRDGRTAKGYIDCGDWAVHQIGLDYNLDSTHHEMERIAREARAIWEAQS